MRAVAATLLPAAAMIHTRVKAPASPLGACVRSFREQRQMSVRALAAETNFSASFISQVENGQASPSIGSLERIATALGVTLGEFFNAMQPEESPVVRAAETRGLTSEWSHAVLESLGPSGRGAALDSMLITLSPGGWSAKHAAAATRDEFLHVLEGTVTLMLGDEEFTLRSGDSATIMTGRLRKIGNVTDLAARLLIVSARHGR